MLRCVLLRYRSELSNRWWLFQPALKHGWSNTYIGLLGPKEKNGRWQIVVLAAATFRHTYPTLPKRNGRM
jgi:hypothetical protein